MNSYKFITYITLSQSLWYPSDPAKYHFSNFHQDLAHKIDTGIPYNLHSTWQIFYDNVNCKAFVQPI